MSAITKGHIEAGGVRYGYEIHGEGAPLLLLHGGFGTIEMFGPVLSRLAERRGGDGPPSVSDPARRHALHHVQRTGFGQGGAAVP
ncbi:MAG TPA: hypothetical protein VIY90_13845 [Steroidobacteraceae bacterium]